VFWPWQRKKDKALTPAQETGRAGERAAERYLRKRGCRTLARNVSYRQGEVDLVALEKKTGMLVFVEVRSRALGEGEEPFAAPEQTVTLAKRRRIISAARTFLAQHGLGHETPVRFDIVGVYFDGDDRKRPRVKHFPGAFDVTGR
jgi:putative endonuclease